MPDIVNAEAIVKLISDLEGSRIVKVFISGAPATLVLDVETGKEQRLKLIITPKVVPGLCGNLITANGGLDFHWEAPGKR